MASVNKVIILGNCGRDPEVRYLANGMAVANTSIATSTRRKDKNTGEVVEDTQWHRVQFWDKLAEIAGQYLKKGAPVFVEGSIKYGKFTNKDGVEQNTVDIVASSMQLLGSRDSQEGAGRPAAAPQRPAAQRQAPPQRQAPAQRQAAPAAAPYNNTGNSGSGFDDMEDDIPF